MDTRNFLKFIYAIYNGYHRNINAICNGKLDIEDWGRVLAYKRKGFETCAFACYVESPLFRDKVGIYYNRLKESLANYEKSNWFDYDFDINKNRRTYFEQKYHIIRRREITLACKFLEELMDKSNQISTKDKVTDKVTNEVTDEVTNELSHYNLNYNKEQFKFVYDHLISDKYIDSTTTLEDFIYYFSGNGNKPKNGIKWLSTKVNLSLFIGEFCFNVDKKWKIAKDIFGYNGLAQSYSNSNQKNHFVSLKKALENK